LKEEQEDDQVSKAFINPVQRQSKQAGKQNNL